MQSSSFISFYSPFLDLRLLLFFYSLIQRFLTCGPRTPGGSRLFRKLNHFSQQIKKYVYVKKQNLKLTIFKRSVKVKESEIGG
jgi:hypothetical protein